MRLLLAMCIAGCASTQAIAPGWHPSVWADGPTEATAAEVAVPFPDDQNGTELVLSTLSRARAAGATGLSNFELQVGRCIREIAVAPRAVVAVPSADLDRITVDVLETDYACRRVVDQQLVRTPTEGFARHEGFADTQLEEREDCSHAPRQHVVTRYRFDLDHHFLPPDWAAVARWSQLGLRAGAPRCDATADHNELRVRLHFGSETPPAIAATSLAAPAPSGDIIALARRAETEAKRDHPVEATRLATQALDAWGDGEAVRVLDEAAGVELVRWVAAAHYYAVEAEAAAYLASKLPDDADAAWAATQSAELDRITARYQALRDAIRMPEVDPWLRAGAARLALLHYHVADMLDRVAQHRAADKQREAARGLETASRTP